MVRAVEYHINGFNHPRTELKDDFIVRTYQHGDEKEIVELLNMVFKGWPKLDLSCTTLEYWKWKYLHNPIRKNFITVAVSEDKIIGCLHVIPLKIKLGDTGFLCSTAADFASLSDSTLLESYKMLIRRQMMQM